MCVLGECGPVELFLSLGTPLEEQGEGPESATGHLGSRPESLRLTIATPTLPTLGFRFPCDGSRSCNFRFPRDHKLCLSGSVQVTDARLKPASAKQGICCLSQL